MNEFLKPSPASTGLASRGKLYRAAIVGAASLKGKELAELLNERNFPAADIRLLDDDESLGQLEAMGDEISFIQRVRAEQFEHVDFTFFRFRSGKHAPQLERCARRWQRDHRLVGGVGRSAGSDGALSLDRTRARPGCAAGIAAGTLRDGASGCGLAGVAVAARAEGGRDPAGGGYHVRARFGARAAGNG